MKTYYYQIKTPGKTWEEIPVFYWAGFSKRVKASKEAPASIAKRLAKEHNTEVRMTDNPELLQGTYFHPDNL